MSFKNKKFNNEWILSGINSECIDYAEEMGEYLCDLKNGRPGRNALTNSQIRNFFGEVISLKCCSMHLLCFRC